MENSKPVYIAIADDHALIRFSLRTSLLLHHNLKIQFEATNGEELINELKKSFPLPDIVIMDIGMPLMSGYDAIEIIKRTWPAVKLIVHSQYSGDYSVRYMLHKGANAFLSKKDNYHELSSALDSVIEYGYFYSDVAPKELFDKVRRSNQKLPELTAQQKKLLHLIVEGKSNKQIADKMQIAVDTVESYRKEICRKFDVKYRAELIRFAIQNEIVHL